MNLPRVLVSPQTDELGMLPMVVAGPLQTNDAGVAIYERPVSQPRGRFLFVRVGGLLGLSESTTRQERLHAPQTYST
jgi:hypothetical protein